MKNYLKFLVILMAFMGLSFGMSVAWAQNNDGNWQTKKTILSQEYVDNIIKDVCAPMDPTKVSDPHNCYIEQLQCWKDNSGYAKCVTKNCRWAKALDGPEVNAPPVQPHQWNWYCDLTYDPQGINPPGPAIMPPPECTVLGMAWRHRISTLPACSQ